VVDHWWQTETGWSITGGFRGLGLFPPRPGSGGKPAPGYEVVALDEAGKAVPPGQIGSLAVRLPLPPACLPTLWNADDRFREAYLDAFPGHYSTADAGMVDEEGYVWVMSRTDDIINVAGHRLSTGAMEEVLAGHPDVAECAVMGVKDSLKGQVPLGLVVLKAGVAKGEEAIARELVAMVRDRIGPVASFKDARVVSRLPKTRSGKILRGTLRKIADGEAYAVPPTIDDPAILNEVETTLRAATR
jgi:propionyl-CoA synthetase